MTGLAMRGLTVFLALTAAGSWPAAAQRGTAQRGTAATGASVCTVAAGVRPVRELREGSGVALSRRTPGLLWSHNDSGPPMLIALDASGAAKGRVTVAGARVGDWEDVSAGPCPQGSCLYIADIGDNNGVRRSITVYRVPEPRPGDREQSRTSIEHEIEMTQQIGADHAVDPDLLAPPSRRSSIEP